MAKASSQNGSDCEGRKLGERTGLDTRVVLAVNARARCCAIYEIAQYRSEGDKLAAWEVRSQG